MAEQAVRLRRVDREALERAIALRLAAGGNAALQMQRKLKDDAWIEAALFAAYAMQDDTLRLKSWQPAPCWMGDERPVDDFPLAGRVAAWEVRRRLIASGLSAYEPDPIGALAAIEARARGDLPPAA
jgi:hypothetical protein